MSSPVSVRSVTSSPCWSTATRFAPPPASPATRHRDKLSGGQWSKGKFAPGFSPVGLVTSDEVEHQRVGLRSLVNTEPCQDSSVPGDTAAQSRYHRRAVPPRTFSCSSGLSWAMKRAESASTSSYDVRRRHTGQSEPTITRSAPNVSSTWSA